MPTIKVEIKDIERSYESARDSARLGGWLTLALVASMLINFFCGSRDGGLFTIGFLVLGGFIFMWGYNKHHAEVLLKKLDQWSHLNFHKSYHDSYMERRCL